MCDSTFRLAAAAAMMLAANGVHVRAQFDSVDASWTVVDIANGTKPSFDFDAQGRVHVMGMTESRSGIVWYANADDVNGPWSPLTIANGYFYGPGDLRVDSVGTAHVAWHDHDAQDAAHVAIHSDEMVRTRVITPGTHDGWDNSFALAPNGELRMASIFPVGFGATESLVVSSLVGDSWTSDTISSPAAMYGMNTSIEIDRQSRSHVLYAAANNWTGPGAVTYASQNNNGNWSVNSIEDGLNVGRFPTIAIDDDDQVHAAWINVDVEDDTKANVRYATLSGQWEIETVATLESVRLGFSDARKLVSLDIDTDGNPHIAYGDQKTVNYATKNGEASWEKTTVVATDEETLNGLVVLRLNPVDEPGIAFWRPAAVPEQGIVSLAVLERQLLFGDFDQDGILTSADMDLLVSAVGGGDLAFDVNGDSLITSADREKWITDVADSFFGDANLDRRVDFSDFLSLSSHFGENGGWAEGDFDGSGDVQFADFLLLSENFGKSSETAVVPEPRGWSLGALCVFGLLSWRRPTAIRALVSPRQTNRVRLPRPMVTLTTPS